ncbi:MAG: hypothetical protein AAF722_17850 [Cyanobacteria bacterium P01_C01_bin.70]
MKVAVLFNQPWQKLRYLLPRLLFWLVMMLEAFMVWILGYLRSLQPDFPQLMD